MDFFKFSSIGDCRCNEKQQHKQKMRATYGKKFDPSEIGQQKLWKIP